MSKRNISYVKPNDPSFLAKLKAQINYKDPKEAKKQKFQEDYNSDSEEDQRPELEEEKPQIVVLKEGDLTADEVAHEEQRIKTQAAEEKADLSQRIIFNTNKVKDNNNSETTNKKSVKKSKEQRSKASSSKLSFNNEEEEEQ